MRKHIMIEMSFGEMCPVEVRPEIDLACAVAILKNRGIQSSRVYAWDGRTYNPVDMTISTETLLQALESKTVDEIAFF